MSGRPRSVSARIASSTRSRTMAHTHAAAYPSRYAPSGRRPRGSRCPVMLHHRSSAARGPSRPPSLPLPRRQPSSVQTDPEHPRNLFALLCADMRQARVEVKAGRELERLRGAVHRTLEQHHVCAYLVAARAGRARVAAVPGTPPVRVARAARQRHPLRWSASPGTRRGGSAARVVGQAGNLPCRLLLREAALGGGEHVRDLAAMACTDSPASHRGTPALLPGTILCLASLRVSHWCTSSSSSAMSCSRSATLRRYRPGMNTATPPARSFAPGTADGVPRSHVQRRTRGVGTAYAARPRVDPRCRAADRLHVAGTGRGRIRPCPQSGSSPRVISTMVPASRLFSLVVMENPNTSYSKRYAS